MNIVNYKGTNLRVSDIALGGGVLGSRISDQASFDSRRFIVSWNG